MIARRTACAVLAVALCGCAHGATQRDALAAIDTGRFALRTDTGAMYALADHPGRVRVVQFFSSWCVPCLAELNQLQKLVEREPDVTVVGVDFDLDAARTIGAFRATAKVTFPLLVADDATRKGEGVFGPIAVLPTTVVIDPAGVVRGAFTGLVSDASLERLIAAARRGASAD